MDVIACAVAANTALAQKWSKQPGSGQCGQQAHHPRDYAGVPVGLPWATALWEDVTEAGGATGGAAALSLEFFERDDQSRLDDYLEDVTDEAAFLKRTYRKPGNYPAGHRAMVERAKALGRPVIASNTPWEIIRFMRGRDYGALRALTPEQAQLFREPDSPPEGRYRADFDALMGPSVSIGHAATGKKEGGSGAKDGATVSEAEK